MFCSTHAALQVKIGDRVQGGASVLAFLHPKANWQVQARHPQRRGALMELPVPRRRYDDRPTRRMRKGMYILPSLFTTANMAVGFYAILEVVHATAGTSGTSILPPKPLDLPSCSTASMDASPA